MNAERDDDLRILRQENHESRMEIVALKGIVTVLLRQSSLTNEQIRSAVTETATAPVGPDPAKALSLAIPLIDASENERAKNRGG